MLYRYSMSILSKAYDRRLETVASMMVLTVDGMLEADMRVGHLEIMKSPPCA